MIASIYRCSPASANFLSLCNDILTRAYWKILPESPESIRKKTTWLKKKLSNVKPSLKNAETVLKLTEALLSAQNIAFRRVETTDGIFLEILPTKDSPEFLAQAAHRLAEVYPFKSKAYSSGVKIIIDPTYNHGWGEFLLKDDNAEIRISAYSFADTALVKSTLDHEEAHASFFCTWANSSEQIDPRNTHVLGKFPGHAALGTEMTNLQEPYAYIKSIESYLKYSRDNDLPIDFERLVDYLEQARNHAKSFYEMASDVLEALSQKTQAELTNSFSNNAMAIRNEQDGLTIRFDSFHFTNLPFKNFQAKVVVSKGTEKPEDSYTMFVPIATGTTGVIQTHYVAELRKQLYGITKSASEAISETDRLLSDEAELHEAFSRRKIKTSKTRHSID